MKYALALALVFASILTAADISGKWKGTAETPAGTVERTFIFKVDGSKLMARQPATGSANLLSRMAR